MRALSIAAALALVGGVPGALAQTAAGNGDERLAAARELVEAMRLTDYYGAMSDAIIERQAAAVLERTSGGAIAGRTLDADELARFYLGYRAAAREVVAGAMPEVAEATARSYARVLDMSELKGATAFYRSRLGRAMIAKMPALEAEMMAVTARLLQAPLDARVPELLREIGTDTAPAEPVG